MANKQERLARRIEQRVVQASIQSFSGPLPPPEVLQRYNEALANGAERIMAMAERQQGHRHDLEKHVIRANTFDQRLGLILGFVLALFIAGGGFWLIHAGKDGVGIAAVITAIAGPVGAFIWGRQTQAKERAEKATTFPTFTR